MATQVVMPKLSPTMEEGQVVRWLKKEGDKASMGEPLAEIDTDKATMEMQALGSGVLLKILVKDGETAKLGQLIAVLGEPDEDISALLTSAPLTGNGSEKKTEPEAAAPKEAEKAEKPEPTDSAADTGKKPDKEVSAGKSERTDPDNSADKPPENKAELAVAENSEPSERIIVSPIAARMAAEAGINLKDITGTGPSGRIVKRDVEEALKKPDTEKAQGTDQQTKRSPGEPGKTSAAAPSPYHDEPASVIRQTIARRLVTSLGPVPHFFLTIEIEMDNAAEMRKSINALEPDSKISINDIIVKVAAVALTKHPGVNASFRDKTVRYYERADIGVAVAIEDGLITPVIRSADQKSIGQIALEIREMAERARARKLLPEEYTGATCSISNLGMFGVDEFTAVINPPEAAILAIGAVTPKPVVREGEIVIKQLMRVTMSCDHRVIDGAAGARFLQTFKKLLENPLYLLV